MTDHPEPEKPARAPHADEPPPASPTLTIIFIGMVVGLAWGWVIWG